MKTFIATALLMLTCTANAQVLLPEVQSQTDMSDFGISQQCHLYAVSAASAYGTTIMNRGSIPNKAIIETLTPKLIEVFRYQFKGEQDIFEKIVQAGVLQGSLLANDDTITGPILVNPIQMQATFIGNVVNEQCVSNLHQYRDKLKTA